MLSNVLRRAIVVLPASEQERRGLEATGEVERVSGVFLPTLWPPAHCSASPLLLAYVDGHFVALVGRSAVERGAAHARRPKRRRLNGGDEHARARAAATNEARRVCARSDAGAVSASASPTAHVSGVLIPLVDSAGRALPLAAPCQRPFHAAPGVPRPQEGWRALEEWGYGDVVWVHGAGRAECPALEQPEAGGADVVDLPSLVAYRSLFARELQLSSASS